MDRSYSVVQRQVAVQRPKKRVRRVAPPSTASSYVYFCVECDAPVEIDQVILCSCGSRVVRKGKTKKDQVYVAR